ncbi:hypothetical protein NDU88_002900 [Pleurodeles waltl]|uniref:Uncharacterized protein n=1 Tax=Pleurodeles waltl TaxID=8319 RepID=A0AAV7Q8A3_PLEWA|nr:hypothetical protein NDU88_002900 [Pleurodeles waltl]
MHSTCLSFFSPSFFLVFLFMCALASSGGGEVGSAHEGAASHMGREGHTTDSEYTSETEGEGSSTTGTRGDVSDTDTSSEGSSLVVAATSVPTTTTGTAATQRTSPALPAAPQRSPRARSARKPATSFAPGTSGPAPVTPAALSEEVIDLLRTIIVGQSILLNAIQGVEREVHQSNAYLEGIHSGQAAHQRSFNALASALTAAIVPVSSSPLQLPQPSPTPLSQGTASPPPEKHPKLNSAQRKRPRTPGTEIPTLAPSGSGLPPGTPPKVSKGHRRPGKGGKGSTPDKSGSRPAAQECPTSPLPGVQEDTQRPRRAQQANGQMGRKAPPATCQVASDTHAWAGTAELGPFTQAPLNWALSNKHR